ncbi:DUF4012 domain-containing protein [Leifsonia kafniensis]|uniref:DUF4012 domain-containing protein n=2 Tax=Leifsonia kafniensis TaxID=475957 RepID=A0ABP7KDX7_9MICO
MSVPPSRRMQRAHEKKRTSPFRRWWVWTIVFVFVGIVAGGAWLGTRALQAKDDLQAAVPLVSELKAQVLAQDVPAAQATLDKLTPLVVEARELTSDPVWRAAEIVPIAGSNLSAVRELAFVTDSIVTGAIPPLLNVVDTMMSGGLKPVDGALNTGLLVESIPQIEAAADVIENAAEVTESIDTAHTIGQVTDAQKTMSDMLGQITPMLKTAREVLPLLPPALGTDGPRQYLVMFQNNAEARALGGIPGAIVQMTIDNGKISLGQQASGRDFATYGESVIPAPDGVEELYERAFGTSILNSTVRPSFPSAAQIVSTMWQNQFGVTVDGVVSLDPVALSYMLKATGPISLASGDTLTSKNAASVLMNEVYLRYPGETEAQRLQQDEFFGSVVSGVFGAVMSGGNLDPKVLASGMMKAVGERRLLLWSSHEAEMTQLVTAGIDGELPVGTDKTDPVGLYTQDAIGSKMDFYLKQAVTLSQGSCRTDGRENYRVSVDVTNIAPKNAADVLTFYIMGDGSEGVADGDIRIDLLAYAPPGSTIVAVRVDGDAQDVGSRHDGDYPVSRVRTSFSPGETRNVTFDIVAAESGTRTLAAELTPLVYKTPVTTVPLDCAGIPTE